AEELFTNKQGVDRSPSAWAERLRQAFSPAANSDARQEQPVKPTPPRSDTNVALKNQPAPKSPGTTSTPRVQTAAPKPADPPVKLPESTRRFLKPLVGIDPETVPVYEGPLADQITSSNRADGIALDGKIALARTTGGETPEKLGLLAHELTHVARQRKPRFVPPVAHRPSSERTVTPSPQNLDEEALARHVEGRVIAAAGRASEMPVNREIPPALISSPSERLHKRES